MLRDNSILFLWSGYDTNCWTFVGSSMIETLYKKRCWNGSVLKELIYRVLKTAICRTIDSERALYPPLPMNGRPGQLPSLRELFILKPARQFKLRHLILWNLPPWDARDLPKHRSRRDAISAHSPLRLIIPVSRALRAHPTSSMPACRTVALTRDYHIHFEWVHTSTSALSCKNPDAQSSADSPKSPSPGNGSAIQCWFIATMRWYTKAGLDAFRSTSDPCHRLPADTANRQLPSAVGYLTAHFCDWLRPQRRRCSRPHTRIDFSPVSHFSNIGLEWSPNTATTSLHR